MSLPSKISPWILVGVLLVGCESEAPAPAASGSAKGAAATSAKTSASAAPPHASATASTALTPLLPPLPSAVVLPPAEGKEALGLPDPGRADPAKLLAKAREIARRVEPTAVLVAMAASPVSRGTVNLGTLTGYVQWTFEWKNPKGKGKAKEGSVVVSATASGIGAADPGPAALSLTTAESLGVEAGLADPKCQLADAWGKLRAAGFTDETIATVRLTADAGTGKAMFIVNVEGRPELTRRLDAITCDVEGPTRLSAPTTPPLVVGTP